MAHHDYLIRYSNGFKRYVSRSERDILSASLQQIGSREYLSTASLQIKQVCRTEPNFYHGLFIWELGRKRRRERMESSEAMALRMEASA